MTTVFDVANYILEKEGELPAMRLQRLVYYSKAWSLVWDEEELFPEEIQAWSNGAVIPALYAKHKGVFKVTSAFFGEGNSLNLSANQKDTIDQVLNFYGNLTTQELSDLNRQEEPYRIARRGILTMVRGSTPITAEAMFEYYSGL